MSVIDHTTYNYHDTGTVPEIRHLFETHRKYLKDHPLTTLHTVENSARPFYYNLYGYLIYKDIPAKLHWLILMLSDIASPEDFDEGVEVLVVPDLEVVEEILQMSGL